MTIPMTRRSVFQLTGAVGLTGALTALGAAPAHAVVSQASMIARMQDVADQLQSKKIGYDQAERWSFLDKSGRTIKSSQDCDCSSSCGAIAWLAGYSIKGIGGDLYTGNFADYFVSAGFTKIGYTSSRWKTGDFILAPGHHVVFARDPDRWWSAEHNESGGASGGKDGDQGGECYFRAPYERSGGWSYILRPPVTGSAV